MKNITAGFSGRVSWSLIEGGQTVQSGKQSNLITDRGLHQMAQYGILAQQLGGGTGNWKNLLLVGDGNTPPNASQTALVHVTGASSSSGGISEEVRRISDGVYEWQTTREIGEADGNGNLTEFGFSAATGAQLCIRELFRDGAGNPVVLTKTADQKLRVTHTLRIEIGPVVAAAQSTPMTGDASGDLGGLFVLVDNGRFDTFHAYRLISRWLRSPQDLTIQASSYAGNPVFDSSTHNAFGPDYIGNPVFTEAAPYQDNLTRTFDCTFDTADAVGEVRSVFICTPSTGGNARPGALWQFAAPFTKDNAHRLTFRGWTLTWGRTPPVSIT